MGKTAFINFPASEIKTATDSVMFAVARYVVGKFPQNVIRQYYVDTTDSMRDIYKNALSNYNGKTSISGKNNEEMLKTPRPHLFVGYTFDSGFETTETGLGETQPYMHPNAFWFQESMQSSHPIFHDVDRNIYIATNNIRIRTTAEFVITTQNREEQFTIYNYILNSLKMYYSMPLHNIEASFILPSYMATYIKDMLYGRETDYKTIENDMDEYLKKNSGGGIYPVYRNNKKDDKFYELKYHYNRIDFKMTGKPQIDEGNKSGDAADNYTVRFPATIEFYIPSNYTIKTPELIPNGCGGVFEVPDAIKLDPIEDGDLMDHVQTVIKTYDDDLLRKPFLEVDGYELLKRTEFAITEPSDSFNLKDCFGDDQNVIKILNAINKELFDKYFKIFIYEGRYMLDVDKYMTVDENFNVFIDKGDIMKTHTIELYVAMEEFENYLDKIKRS